MINNEEAYIKVTIKSILNNFKDDVSLMQTMYEAISNSLEANATQINLEIITNGQSKEELKLGLKPLIIGFKIIDNGEGFTDENITSFNEYMSPLKRKQGCKGIGHFTWLKVFNNIHIESYTSQQLVKFDFNLKYNPNNIHKEPNNSVPKTSIIFSGLTQHNKAKEADIDDIIQNIQEHLLIKLFLKKKNKETFNINVICGSLQKSIDNETVPDLEDETFTIQEQITNDKKNFLFKLYYAFFSNGKNKRDTFYCGNGRVVRRFLKSVKVDYLPEKDSTIMLLTSDYFDGKVNDIRSDFTFNVSDNNPSVQNPIPFPDINEKLQQKIDEIIVNRYPSLQNDNEKVVEDCIKEYPYLAKYIKKDNSLIKIKKSIIENAEKMFLKEKEYVKNNFNKLLSSKNIDNEEYKKSIEKINEISARELAQYFMYRGEIIKALGNLQNQNEDEDKLHILFMPKGNKSVKDSKKYYDTNVWLLDDKYMAYSEIYSDVKIKSIKEAIANMNLKEYGVNKEPDLAIFYNTNNSPYKDLVVVEFKALNVGPDRKITAYTEINRNIKFIAGQSDNIRNIYGYVITKIDNEFQEYIESQAGIKTLFSNGSTPYYYLYNENIKDKNGIKKDCHIYFVSTETIYSDAKSRNDTFLDIIKNK